jgi:hypothetical protein
MELLEQNSSGFTDMKIVVTGYQGKAQSGWMCPPNGLMHAQPGMDAFLKHEINEISQNVAQERRSDSYPRNSGGPSDNKQKPRAFLANVFAEHISHLN